MLMISWQLLKTEQVDVLAVTKFICLTNVARPGVVVECEASVFARPWLSSI